MVEGKGFYLSTSRNSADFAGMIVPEAAQDGPRAVSRQSASTGSDCSKSSSDRRTGPALMPWTASQQSLCRLSPHASAPFLKLLLRGFGRHRRTARQDPHVVEPEPVEGPFANLYHSQPWSQYPSIR